MYPIIISCEWAYGPVVGLSSGTLPTRVDRTFFYNFFQKFWGTRTRARLMVLRVSRALEARESPNFFFVCVQTRTRVCACGVSVWVVCVQLYPIKKKSKLQNQRFHTFYVSTSLIPFHDKLLSQTILCCVKPPLAGTKSCNKDTEVWQDMWEKASNSYRGCLINILDYKISSFFLVCVCLSVFIAD